ncbi:ABC transporter ATP-binding protein [Pelolinea submarina]|uniref:ATP-binding cassette subfamily B protein/subfamily B ATP-binding cassette protein MsbA n=1 Tax=Pelolinea submarina TaxID=913107 RepID=A0A347ZQT0_9CHLR|nr:ABC transporter ATP-binding protein [Pelolinea submarina]REG11783.1 ATP-binding cassette subfamily B protein/subfamily B ATP-binding cassette protein MsbA [Pelolinea submarina]BBB47661.1 ABC type transport system ATP-binding protein and permease [Pelolinea submarina]
MKSFRFVYQYLRKYSAPLVVTIVSMLLLVGVQLIGPWLVKQMVAIVSSPGLAQSDMLQITHLALLALGVYLLRILFQYLRSYMAHIAGWGVVADVRLKLYEHVQRLSLRFYENTQTGDLMSQMVNDTDLLENLIAHAIPDLTANVLTLVGVLAILFSINAPLALLSMIPVPLIILTMQGFNKFVNPAFRERQRKLGELNAVLNDNLSGVREIQAFSREDLEVVRMNDHVDQYRTAQMHALRLMATFHPLIEFASSLGTIVLIYFGGKFVLGQTLAVDGLVAFFLYLEQLYQPIREMSKVWENVQQALAGAQRVNQLFNEAPNIVEKPDAIDLPLEGAKEIQLRNVSFQYDAGIPVLDNINLTIPAGKVVALVGPTGVGKTTLANLIPRFYDVSAGSLSIDGRDVRDLSLKSIRQQISIVLQNVFLFHGTVRENILFGRQNASQEEMIQAARVANAHDFICELPDGYDTMIGERGVKLSGGQRQRIAIARTVLKDAPILILDEATSSVDTETELLIQQALDQLMEGRTVIIIAHRLSTIHNADLIVVLEGSHVVEQGTHRELMKANGLYKRLVDVQFNTDIVANV